MNEMEVLDIAKDSLMTMLVVSAPILVVGLIVGLIISIFQTLTHIQEMTLTFIPKIVAVFATTILVMPWMLEQMVELLRAAAGGS